MPRSRSSKVEALQQVKAAWVSRGYRADYLLVHEHKPEGDPQGELAYQRGFAEAAKKDPPRLPNPSHYPNSDSAQALIQRQNKEIFSARSTDAANPRYEPPIPDYYRQQIIDDERYRSASSTPPLNHNSAQTSPIQQNGHHRPSIGQPYMTSPNQGPAPRLLIMEPKMGAPMGPPSRLR